MEDLTGRKIRGFKFRDRGGICFIPPMEKRVGEVGTITCQNPDGDCIVEFQDGARYFYPADEFRKHLIEEYTIGGKYEFKESGGVKWRKGELLAEIDHDFKYAVKLEGQVYPVLFQEIREVEIPQEFLEKAGELEKLAVDLGIELEIKYK